MKYNIEYYSSLRAVKREKYFKSKPIFSKKGVDSNKIFFDCILDSLNFSKNKRVKVKILDIGTGTGYVPQVLCSISNGNFKIVGIDLSEDMIKVAQNRSRDSRIKYLIADNNKLPFKDESFDIVTNKLSTQFNFNEIHRVLKKDGAFIFKEYGENKGFKEIREIFKNRYKKTNKSINDYILEMSQLGFKEIRLNLYQVKRTYNQKEINDIFSMADLIEKFNKKDLNLIIKKLEKRSLIVVTSDPFIVFAKK